jgi:hypothetical protein
MVIMKNEVFGFLKGGPAMPVKLLLLIPLALLLSGCFLTKAVTVPMRVGGAVVSVVPVVGNPVDDGIGYAADGIDKIPL